MSGKKGNSGATPPDNNSRQSPKLSRVKPSKPILDEVRMTRRLLVNWLMAAGGTVATAAAAQDKRVTATVKPNIGQQVQQQAKPLNEQIKRRPDLTFHDTQDTDTFAMIRPKDLLVLDVKLINMIATGRGANRIIKRTGSGPALMLVEHQPQAIVEGTYPDTLGQKMPSIDKNGNPVLPAVDPASQGVGSTTGPINSFDTAETYISGPSRLAYVAPGSFTDMAFSAAAVLDACATWKLNLDLRALDAPDAATMPSAHEFDRIRTRLSDLSAKQKSDLHDYGPKAEALLRRIAKRIAEAILLSANAGKRLSDAAINRLIDYEIRATLHANGVEASDPLLTVDKDNLFINLAVTQELATQPLFMMDGISITPSVILTNPKGPIGERATDIEVPWRLHMTPLSTAGFAHARNAVDQGGQFTELWHTRMGTKVSDWVIGDNPEPLRALYADDTTQPQLTPPWWALSSQDRKQMVKLMSSYSGGYISRPAMAKHLRLTALGGSLDAEGIWPDHALANDDEGHQIDIEQWKHVSSIGRDQFVRVIYAGYLFPFGHAASLVKVSERKFSRQIQGGRVAGLMQKYYILVRERVKTYPDPNQRYEGRDFPFASIEIPIKQSADLTAPAEIFGLPTGYYGSPKNAERFFETFWPQLMGVGGASGGDMLFPIVATDTAGRKTTFDMPLIFVAGSRNNQSSVEGSADLVAGHSNIEDLCLYYNSHLASNRKRDVKNALIRFSRNIDGNGKVLPDGESDYHASTLTFEAWKATKNVQKGPRFFPRLGTADLEVPAIKNMLGTKVPAAVTYKDLFLTNGFDSANPAQVVFGFTGQSVNAPPSDKFGGMIDPGLFPDGLSRKLGVLTDLDKYLGGSFDPVAALSGAKLFGVVPLGKLLLDVVSFDSPNVPQLKTVHKGDSVVTSYTIEKDKVHGFEIFVPLDPGPDKQLSIVTTVTVSKAGQPPEARVDAQLLKFKLNLFGFIILNFNKLSLTVKPGSKTDVDPVFHPTQGVMFGGPLEFMNSLRDVIPMDGFSDPPGIDVSPGGITASYSLGLPDIGVGALTLQNVNLGAGFTLPFTGEGPSARFNFAERHNPFNLTVSMFGGGGFFAVTVASEGVRELEASLEFGAQISIDLGVASGGVYVKGGFYFHWREAPTKLVEFEGYVELGGHLSVLGLITVSLTFHLGLTYEKTDHSSRLYGTATLTVEIDILFFSISQSITVEREFAGSDADPLFIEFAPANDKGEPEIWNNYCAAFA